MSMSRSTLQEMCDYILQKPSNTLGNKFFDCRLAVQAEVASKSDKYEQRILVISKFRVFIIAGKSPSTLKIEKSCHLLNIKSIQTQKDDTIAMTWDDCSNKKKLQIRSCVLSSPELVRHFLTALKHYYPDIGVQLNTLWEVSPASWYEEFMSIPLDVSPRPCNSFRRTYAAMCDFYDQPYREEVSWDIEKIYTINNLRSLRIEDFSHLLPKDLLPICGVLQYSGYFNGLEADGVRIPPDLVDVILNVLRKSPSVKHLKLVNCGLPRDFITVLSSALQHNQANPLQSLDLSKNVLDDKKGFSMLASVLPRLTSLNSISFAECGLSEKCTQYLCTGIYNGLTASKAASVLTVFNIACNVFKDDVTSLINMVSLCTSLRVLDLTDTSFPLDKIWAALKYGGLQIERLVLAGCHVGKKPGDCPQAVKEFFSMAVNLDFVSFANTQLPTEIMKSMLLGLASNQQLKPFSLDLDACCSSGCGSVLEVCLIGVRCKSISLRDNHLESEMQGVLQSLASIPTLRRADVGGANLVGLRRSNKPAHAQTLNRILLDIVKLYGDESSLEELIISKAQLGSHLSVLLNTLGATHSLKHLDISHNDMGNFGARILSKALQLNVSLRSVHIDGNRIGADGFQDIAAALNTNYTLTWLPYPVHDVMECRARGEQPRALSSVSSIESLLERNRCSDSFDLANCKRTLSNGMQTLFERDGDVTAQVEQAVGAARLEALPIRLDDMVDDFVEQLRREASLAIQESLVSLRDFSDLSGQTFVKAERVAADRLKELWVRNAKHVVSDWRWRELCERSEAALRSQATNGSIGSNSVSGSPSIASPRVAHRSTDTSHRPRSIIGEMSASVTSSNCMTSSGEGNGGQGDESGLMLDTPPKPSGLVHLQKARPRLQRKGVGVRIQPVGDEEVLKRCGDLAEVEEETRSEKSEDSESSRKPLSDRCGFRPAMLPEAATVQLRPAADRGSPRLDNHNSPQNCPLQGSSPLLDSETGMGSPGSSPLSQLPPSLPTVPPPQQESMDSPPPVPSRNRSGAAPLLPPKPEPRQRVGATTSAEDDENANSRRSVADMARMFSK